MINNYCRSSPIDLARGALHLKVADHSDVEECSPLFLLKPRRELKRTIRNGQRWARHRFLLGNAVPFIEAVIPCTTRPVAPPQARASPIILSPAAEAPRRPATSTRGRWSARSNPGGMSPRRRAVEVRAGDTEADPRPWNLSSGGAASSLAAATCRESCSGNQYREHDTGRLFQSRLAMRPVQIFCAMPALFLRHESLRGRDSRPMTAREMAPPARRTLLHMPGTARG